MNTNTYSIRILLKVRYYFQAYRPSCQSNRNLPTANPVLLSILSCHEGVRKKEGGVNSAIHWILKQMNLYVFLASVLEMSRFIIAGPVLTYTSVCDREITLR